MEKEDVDKIYKLKEEIEKVSDELAKEASRVDGDIITIRNHPKVKEIWNKLCRLHMKAMVICEYDAIRDKELAKVCDEILRPRACVEALHLSEEATCCGRFLKRVREERER